MNTNITINGTVMAVIEKDYNNEKTLLLICC